MKYLFPNYRKFGIKGTTPLTIYVHGTKFFQMKSSPSRLAKAPQPRQLERALHKSNPTKYPYDSVYRFSWSGRLHHRARQKAAQDLFDAIKEYKGPITIIAHSHGCNVSLWLAKILTEEKHTISLDKVIFLAPPVQMATMEYVTTLPQVYSFYSTADMVQVVDPQRLQARRKDTPLFSQRLFPESLNLCQTRILFHNQSPGHQSFITESFLVHLDNLITTLPHPGHMVCTIDKNSGRVTLMEKEQFHQSYVPRITRRAR